MSKTGWIIIGSALGVIALIFLVVMLFQSIGGSTNPGGGQPVKIQFWGVYDDPSYYSDIINDYQKLHPNVYISYRSIAYADYETELLNAFASGTGPDIWLMHNTWLPKHSDKIQPLPQMISGTSTPLFTSKDFTDQFVDQAAADLIKDGQIYGLPLYIDTLALYYNKQMFNSAGIASPPKTWNEFNDDVSKLTQMDNRGNIAFAGAAIGTAQNINRSTDILGLLMLQSGVKMTDSDNYSASFSGSVNGQNVGEIALQYYTDFANPSKKVYTWNGQQHYSVDAFVEGKAAMMFNYSHQILTLRAKSPRLNFSIAPMPQLSDSGTKVNYANYWAPTVWKQSANSVEAWKFLVYLTSQSAASKYINISNRPPARRDLIQQKQNEADLGVFAEQALSARSWYQIDNVQIENIFAEMIDNVNFGRASIREALQDAESKVNVLMQKNRR